MTLEEYQEKNQQEHHDIRMAVKDLESIIKLSNKDLGGKLDAFIREMKQNKAKCERHIEESVPLRDNIRDNTRFRKENEKTVKDIPNNTAFRTKSLAWLSALSIAIVLMVIKWLWSLATKGG